MSVFSPLLFGEDFGAGASRSAPRPAAPAAPPAPTAAEIEAKIEAAYAEGLRDGHARAVAAQDEAARRQMERLVTSLEQAEAAATAAAVDTAEAIGRLLVACLLASFPQLDRTLGPTAAVDFAREVVFPLSGMPSITLRCSPHTQASLEELLRSLPQSLADSASIIATDALMPGDLEVSWANGCAERDTRKLWQAMRDSLAAHGVIETGAAIPENALTLNLGAAA